MPKCAGCTSVHTLDSNCINFSGTGSTADPLTAVPILDPSSTILSCGASGLKATVSVDDLAVFSRDGVLTTGTGVGRFRFPFAAMILGVSAAVNTAPAGASIILDINKNGASIFPVAPKPTIAIAANDTGASEYVPDTMTIISGDYLTVDRDQVGSTTPGSDLTVFIRYVRVLTS